MEALEGGEWRVEVRMQELEEDRGSFKGIGKSRVEEDEVKYGEIE